MLRKAFSLACAVAVLASAAHATTPQDVLSELNADDPLYGTASCTDARNIAMQYDNKGMLRGAVDVATFLAGPLSTATYAAIDHGHVKSRDAVVNEIRRRCISNFGTPDYSATKDSRQCSEKEGKIVCEAAQ